ncbi:MAG: hypothetical protein D6728_13090 [Cyanobacteria bacterium J055]|nr:MAG: hypothetical protein D6728_13090 [Cyanobacteria bacterium J055]
MPNPSIFTPFPFVFQISSRTELTNDESQNALIESQPIRRGSVWGRDPDSKNPARFAMLSSIDG